jgi:hypothetical protein
MPRFREGVKKHDETGTFTLLNKKPGSRRYNATALDFKGVRM